MTCVSEVADLPMTVQSVDTPFTHYSCDVRHQPTSLDLRFFQLCRSQWSIVHRPLVSEVPRITVNQDHTRSVWARGVDGRLGTTEKYFLKFLANVNFRYMSSSVRLSVVWNVGAPYSDDWNFRQCFYAVWYVGHLLTSRYNFTEIVPGEPLRWGC